MTTEPREVHDRELDEWRETSHEALQLMNLRQGALDSFAAERLRQIVKWGNQRHPDGTGGRGRDEQRDMYQAIEQAKALKGKTTWLDILLEEVFEAAAEADDHALEHELVQVGGVVTAWIEDIRARRLGG